MDKKTATIAIASLMAGSIGGAALAPNSFDCKGQECQVQVLVTDPSFKDAIYYSPDQWNKTTEAEIDTEAQSRYDRWKTLVQEQSLRNDDATTTPNN